MQIVDRELLTRMTTNTGQSVLDISIKQPVLVVFLRHFGCQYCRQALADLSKLHPQLEAQNTELVFVHMAENEIADTYFKKFKLEGIQHISDPTYRYYTAFGLMKGTVNQLFGFQSWVRGFAAMAQYGSETGRELGDNTQMPGVFTLFEGEIRDSYIHRIASDRPDYMKLTHCCTIQ
jgi:peroxiredoxin